MIDICNLSKDTTPLDTKAKVHRQQVSRPTFGLLGNKVHAESRKHAETKYKTAENSIDKDNEAAQKLLAKKDEILDAIEQSVIFKTKLPRKYPVFDASEIVIGRRLGVGGFGIVCEVANIELNERFADFFESVNEQCLESLENTTKTQGENAACIGASVQNCHVTNNGVLDDCEHHHEHDGFHYEVTVAREFMTRRVYRPRYDENNESINEIGDARYAIKRLKRFFSEYECARGMIDLAIEAKFLSALWHPNIVKMRGVATGEMVGRHFFIIMDRLYDTLAQRCKSWRRAKAQANGGIFGWGVKRATLHDLLIERLVVAYDISSALTYMHENRVIYRDIKPENFGFDVRGDIKIFDFGLSKTLHSSLKAKDSDGKEVYGYKLSACTGSRPYMAPEVAFAKPYDEKCDVFGFALLLWEIISLKVVYREFGRFEYWEHTDRPSITQRKQWPPLTRLVLKEAWDQTPTKRPDMMKISKLLRKDLNDLSTDAQILNRSKHMKNRSAHSRRGSE